MAYVPPHRRGARPASVEAGGGDRTRDVKLGDNGATPRSCTIVRHHPDITPTVYSGAKILCYGDSLTAGYCSPSFTPYAEGLREVLQMPVDYAGLCGWTTRDMLRQAGSEIDSVLGLAYPGLRQLVQHGGYSVVILMGGTNDLGSFYSPETIVDGLSKLHQICHAAGCCTVAVSIPQSYYASDGCPKGKLSLRSSQKKANSLLREYAQSASERCIFADMECKVPYSKETSDWESDGLHMSSSGYKKFGRLLGPLVEDFVSSALRLSGE